MILSAILMSENFEFSPIGVEGKKQRQKSSSSSSLSCWPPPAWPVGRHRLRQLAVRHVALVYAHGTRALSCRAEPRRLAQHRTITWVAGSDAAAALRDGAPELFDPQASGIERVVTEFGAAIHCRHAFFASLVELTKPADGDTRIAMIHAGLDSWLSVPEPPVEGRRLVRLPGSFEGLELAHVPRSRAASAAWRLAVASAARLNRPKFGTFRVVPP